MLGLVSVVIPTCRRADTLKRAMDSVLCQTYKTIEICVVIDGFDEETRQLVMRYIEAGKPVRCVQTTGIGGSAARNLGVQMAQGEWIAFLDDDDEFLPTKLERQLGLLGFDSEKRHLAFTSVLTYKPNKERDTYVLPYMNWEEMTCSVGEYLFCRKGRRTIGFMQTSTLLIPRKILLEIPFTDGLKKHQDWDLLLRMEAAGIEIRHLESPETIYHQHDMTAKHVGQQNAWRFSEEWMQTVPLSRNAQDAFLLSIVNRGIATDRMMTSWERQKELGRRFLKVRWGVKEAGSYVYMAGLNMVRSYLK
ncbi:glycosyltransferase family 2 protein [Listeria booriae]|uniref:Glycosyltransferase family 2 protein n=1 Tax=Listeria booriae TaxID=1552123 RepID=A0A7X0YMI7_9LIST|nr:glycosyltransferase family 2 protein [Listeria booriae]MBC2117080.1 glycosyltransferase family 2 protein [Listeria booriae]